MEQLDYNLLYRWFVGLGVDETVWVPTVFTKNRDRLLEADVARKFLAQLMDQTSCAGCCRTSTSRSTARRLRLGLR
jgi:transposase